MNGYCIWLTGIPSAGKTTLANLVKDKLHRRFGFNGVVLDGDEIRANITKGLGFSKEDRFENVTRVAWMAKQIVDSGGIVLVAMVSPHEEARAAARDIIGKERVFTIHVDVSFSGAIDRDVKGLYAKAISGEIKGLTGYDAEYEKPSNPELVINTESEVASLSADTIIAKLQEQKRLPVGRAALFIGRWSPFHNGHKYIIDKKVAEGKPIAIGVRCSEDEFDVAKRIEMIQAVYPDAHVFSMVDIESVNIGRLVGYEVNRYDVPDDIAGISATNIRKSINEGSDDWKQFVPTAVAECIERD